MNRTSTPPAPRATRPARRARAFSLIETLFAMGIFVVGFVMVSSLFPVAITLQRQTVDDVTSQIVARNAQAVLDAAKLDNTTLDASASLPVDTKVHPLMPALAAGFPNHPAIAGAANGLDNRSYPSMEPDVTDRKFYWVPLIRRREVVAAGTPKTQSTQWAAYVFVLQRRFETTYNKTTGTWANTVDGLPIPGVRQAAVTTPTNRRFQFNNDFNGDGEPDLRVGDEFLDEFGGLHTAVQSDLTGVTIAGIIPTAGWDAVNPTTTNVPELGQSPASIWIGAAPDTRGKSCVQRLFLMLDIVTP
jgi:type II secretory pathway pseudopilin PulG